MCTRGIGVGQAAVIGGEQVAALVPPAETRRRRATLRETPCACRRGTSRSRCAGTGRCRAARGRRSARDASRRRRAPASIPTSRRTPASARCRDAGAALDIGDQMARRVVDDLAERRRAAGAALVEDRRCGRTPDRKTGGAPASRRRPGRHGGTATGTPCGLPDCSQYIVWSASSRSMPVRVGLDRREQILTAHRSGFRQSSRAV